MLANDLETARFNMVAQQIRPNEVIDERVLDTLQAVPRERFVNDEYRNLAFADIEVPIGESEVMMKPLLEARMLQALQIGADDSILEIGTGTGFTAACMARLGAMVTSYEIHAALSKAAADRMAELGIHNVELVVGDAFNASLAPDTFKVIAVTGSIPCYDESLEILLAPGGRMFVVVGEAPAMTAMLVTRNDDGEIWKENLFETVVPALHNAPEPSHFTF